MNSRTHIKTKKYAIFVKKNLKIKNILKLGPIITFTGEYTGAAHSICNLRYDVPKEIPIVFHRVSNYDYHFIIKELGEEFEK